MFKQAISAVTSSVVGAAKRTIDEYKPSNAVAEGGAFERIAQQGIVNMSYRSPVMADMATTMLKAFQVEIARKANVRSHVKSSGADGLREAVRAGMDKDASPKKVEAQMESILTKMQATLEKSGTEEAKKTDLFSKYGKYFETFQAAKKGNAESQSPEQAPGVAPGTGGGVDGVAQALLGKIESNTLRTVNALEVSASRANLMGSGQGGGTGGTGASSPFIDPLTGMPSITAAVGHVGGSFLGKVFDDDMISKYADKLKSLLDPSESAGASGIPESIIPMEKKVTPKKAGGNVDSIVDVVGNMTLDLNTDADSNPVVDDVGVKPKSKKAAKAAGSSVPTEAESNAAKAAGSFVPTEAKAVDGIESITTSVDTPAEISAQQKDSADELKEVSIQILEEIKELNSKSSGVEKAPTENSVSAALEKNTGSNTVIGGVNNVSKKVGSVKESIKKGVEKASYVKPPIATTVPAGGGLGGLGGVAARGVASAVGGAAPAAAAGGGIMAGIGSTLLAGAGLVAAGVGGVMAGSHAVSPLIDKGISTVSGKETSLGGAIYDLLNDDPMAAEAVGKKVSPVTSSGATTVQALASKEAKINAAPSAPIVINAGGGNNAPAPASSSNTVVNATPSIRNQESTFERVQMQDFWPRTA